MEYLLEVSRIVDGAIKGDRDKMLAYLNQITRKLRENGDDKSAICLERALSDSGGELALSSFVSPKLPVDSESRFSLADEESLAPDAVKIILDDATKDKVSDFIRYIGASDVLLANKVGITPSMIICGPPGVGKTELARYIAARLHLPLLTARSDSLISSFLGSTAKNLRALFSHAQSRPCVLFMDEFDSIAKLRDDQHELGELKRVVISLLQNIDSLKNETILLAATNHPHLLDPAVWRRFAYKIELGLPSFSSRENLFGLFLSEFSPPKKADLEILSELASGLSGAEIRQLSEQSIRNAVLNGESTFDARRLKQEIIVRRMGRVVDFSAGSGDMKAVADFFRGTLKQRIIAELFNISIATVSRRNIKRK